MSNYFALPLFELQKVIFEKLSNNTVLMSRVEGVFDAVDEGQTFPYVTISEPRTNPLDTKTSNIERISFTMHVYTKDNDEYAGKRIAYEILSLCQQTLSTRNYVIPGARVLDVTRVEVKVFDDNQDGVKHGILTMRYKIQNL